MGQVSAMFRSHALNIDMQRSAFKMVPQDGRATAVQSMVLFSTCSALSGLSSVDVEGGAPALEGN